MNLSMNPGPPRPADDPESESGERRAELERVLGAAEKAADESIRCSRETKMRRSGAIKLPAPAPEKKKGGS